ncbi:Hypothetical predicted protein [Cloeon dipterum]|uniref:Uncharacterized protein n=1 Tax=Cloeon dipterum TaxID=197152 RepID=A0A8S1E5G5_9INSE|nr:Hypothetical predicted protein [Cloeon dipterum]
MQVIENPESLMELTLTTIILNLHCYGENLDKKLEPELRQMVLKHLLKKSRTYRFWDYSKNAWLVFPSLLSRETKEIDTYSLENMLSTYEMDSFERSSKFSISKVIQHLAGKAANLQKLTINHNKGGSRRLRRKEITSLRHLKNLSRLHISESIVLLSEVKTIVKNCRGLQFIKIYKLVLDGEKKVDFFDDGFLHHQIQFGSHDTTIRLDKDLPKTDHHFVGPGPHYHLVGYPKKVKNLEFLEMQKHATALTMYCEYFWDALKVVRFPRLPKLRSATFLGSYNRTHVLESFLEENGSHLSRLGICRRDTSHSTVTAGLTLEKIFGWCSNLEWLSLNYLSLSSYNVPVGCLSKLKSFKCLNRSGMCVDISSMLSAPQLEDFEIKIRNLDLGDKETLFSRIAQKEILINLKRYKIDAFPKEDAADLLEDQLIATIKSAIPDVKGAITRR